MLPGCDRSEPTSSSFHSIGGSSTSSEPREVEIDLAELLWPLPDIDLIIGHHAHVIQPLALAGGGAGRLRPGKLPFEPVPPDDPGRRDAPGAAGIRPRSLGGQRKSRRFRPGSTGAMGTSSSRLWTILTSNLPPREQPQALGLAGRIGAAPVGPGRPEVG